MIRKLALRAFKPFFVLYYRFFFDRDFPGSEKAARWVLSWERWTGRQNIPVSGEAWESEYGAGSWDFLHHADELARYCVVAGYVHHFKPGGSILDVGCGEGILVEHLELYGISRYLGVDISETAIARCSTSELDGVDFLAADAERYRPESAFDAVVFNECLYYFNDPIEVALAYAEKLAENGVLVISQFQSRRADAIAKRLREEFALLESTRITNRKGSWIVDVVGKKRS